MMKSILVLNDVLTNVNYLDDCHLNHNACISNPSTTTSTKRRGVGSVTEAYLKASSELPAKQASHFIAHFGAK
jgi:hypothetical protein